MTMTRGHRDHTKTKVNMHAPRKMWRGRVPVRSSNITFVFGICAAIVLTLTAIGAPLLNLPDPNATNLGSRLLPPGAEGHLLGTDQLGRDVLSRVIAGAQWTLGIGLTATTIGLIIGVTLGVTAASGGKIVSTILSRVIEVGLAFPYLVIAITVVAILGRGFWSLALTLGVVCWPPIARVVYAEALSIRENEYLLAAKFLGVHPIVSVFTHVLPALRPTILVMAAFIFAEMMITESGMSFLGLGAPLGDPTWGNSLSESRGHMATAPWMLLAPATGVVIAVVSANFIGDGLTARSARKEGR